jgi:hypothetical protein
MLMIISIFTYSLLTCIEEIDTTTVQLLELSLRTQHRALDLALGATLRNFEEGIFPPAGASQKTDTEIRHSYPVLHSWLVSGFRTRTGRLTVLAAALVWLYLLVFLFFAINPIAASCLPTWTIAYFAFTFLVSCSTLVRIAAANGQIVAIAELYRDALRDFRELAVHAQDQANVDRDVLSDMKAHEALLLSFAEVDKYRAIFLGYAVTFSTIRTIVGTLATILIALWGVFRNSGTSITMQSICFV